MEMRARMIPAFQGRVLMPSLFATTAMPAPRTPAFQAYVISFRNVMMLMPAPRIPAPPASAFSHRLFAVTMTYVPRIRVSQAIAFIPLKPAMTG